MPSNANLNYDYRRDGPSSAVPLIIAIFVWIAAAWFSHHRLAPPKVVEAYGPSLQFSAARAEPIFQRLYRDTVPHPAGDNADFRRKVIDEFNRLGYQVQMQSASAETSSRKTDQKTVPLVNLIVTLIGKTDKPPVMLAAHYDSVPTSPGAADDGVGVTALIEIARMLLDEPPLDRTVVFLLTDGEEYGLLGAEKFMQENPLSDEIAAVVNLEARGTSGPSLMFETSADSHWLVELFARTSRRPFASSLFYEVYRFLPNDTDFSRFRDSIRGYNLAFIGDVKNYHTPNDNFENVDRGSLQHHGENALALIRALANSDIERMPRRSAVYFDFFGYFIVYWPGWLSFPVAAVSLAVIARFSRDQKINLQKSPPGETDSESANAPANRWTTVGFLPVAFVGSVVLGKILATVWWFEGAFDLPWPDHPVPLQAGFWSFTTTFLIAITWQLHRQLNWRSVWLAVWLTWSVTAIAVSILIQGACYLFLVPVVAIAMASYLVIFFGEQDRHRNAIFISMVGSIAVGLIWIPLERLFYDAVGFRMNTVLVLRCATALTSLLPLMVLTSRKWLGWMAVASLVSSIALALLAAI